MNEYCAAPKCMQKCSKQSTITFHSFPTNRELKRIWLQSIGQKGYSPPLNSKLCSLHFTSNCFEKKSKGPAVLKEGAIPTLFNKCDISKNLKSEGTPKLQNKPVTKRSAPNSESLTPNVKKLKTSKITEEEKVFEKEDISSNDRTDDKKINTDDSKAIKKKDLSGEKTVLMKQLKLKKVSEAKLKSSKKSDRSGSNKEEEKGEISEKRPIVTPTKKSEEKENISKNNSSNRTIEDKPEGKRDEDAKTSVNLPGNKNSRIILIKKEVFEKSSNITINDGLKNKVFFLDKNLLNEALQDPINNQKFELKKLPPGQNTSTAGASAPTTGTPVSHTNTSTSISDTPSGTNTSVINSDKKEILIIGKKNNTSKPSTRPYIKILPKITPDIVKNIDFPNNTVFEQKYKDIITKNEELNNFNATIKRRIKTIQQRYRRHIGRVKKLKRLIRILIATYGRGQAVEINKI